MQMDQIKQGIDRFEQRADEAKRAVQAGSAPQELRQSVEQMHQQAHQAQQQGDAGQLRQTVAQLEQAGDRAMQACRQAGAGVTPQMQQAVQRAHEEISHLKKQMQMQ